MHGHRHIGPIRATRAIVALVAGIACLGGVAYAATQPGTAAKKGGKTRPGRGQTDGPPRPRLIEVPPSGGIRGDVQFRFHVAPPQQQPAGGKPGTAQPAPPKAWRRFECRFEDGDWSECSSPRRFAGLAPGEHSFAVRALNRRGVSGPAAHYRWAQLELKGFTIDADTSSLAELMPGAPAQVLPVQIGNPNPEPIEVTSLTVAVADLPGCPGDPNFAVTPAGLSATSPLLVPANATANLPSASVGAPTLALRELASDQNACQGATVELVFSGEARG